MTTEEVGREEEELTFWDHLYELLTRLRRVVIAWLVAILVFLSAPASLEDLIAMVEGGVYRPLTLTVMKWLEAYIKEASGVRNITLIPAEITTPLELYVEASILLATAAVVPYFAYEMYMFLEPALYPHEKRFIKRFVFGFSAAFLFGIIYGFVVIAPITFRILLLFVELLGWATIINARTFFNTLVLTVLASGLIFTIPVFMVMAFRFGVLHPDMVANIKRYIYVGVLILAAIITADPTPVSMLLISIPFILVFELSIWIGRWMLRKEESGQGE